MSTSGRRHLVDEEVVLLEDDLMGHVAARLDRSSRYGAHPVDAVDVANRSCANHSVRRNRHDMQSGRPFGQATIPEQSSENLVAEFPVSQSRSQSEDDTGLGINLLTCL